jgi:hypothetical protein
MFMSEMTQSPADEGVMRRIQKCLALAMDPAAAPGEAENALRMAQNMMKKYGVTDGQIASSQIGEFLIQGSKATTPCPWETDLAWLICHAFGSKLMWSEGYGPKGARTKGWFTFVAHKPQLEMIKYAYELVRRQLVAERTKFVASLPEYWTRPRKAREGDEFGRGFVAALRKKVSDYANPEGLQKALEDRIEERTGGRKSKDVKEKRGSREAYFGGADKGQHATLNRGVA